MGSSSTIPKAYLVWLFFDNSHQFVNAGGQAITAAAFNSFEKLSVPFTATQSGYLYIYVANESNVSSNTSVFFDETYIVHEKNNLTLQVLQPSDYYPFGQQFNQFQADRLREVSSGNHVPELRNRYLLQGQELQKDLALSQYQFQWRMYDPDLGRWSAADPLAGHANQIGMSAYSAFWNNPMRYSDPDGRCPKCPDDNYSILKGDNFWKLENRWGLGHGSLQAWNPGLDPTKLQIGQVIKALELEIKDKLYMSTINSSLVPM